ncbi:MAG: AAA family ATPase, partial [Anaerolineae bacterium]|nr:AAA family ATPase [Anaerolineae bacterium]
MTKGMEHTLAQLARLDLLIRRAVVRLRQGQASRADDEFRGLYVSDDEVDALLDGSRSPLDLWGPAEAGEETTPLEAALRAAENCLAQVEAELDAADVVPPLDQLARLFRLSDFERDVLVVCLAAEFDLKYERLYGYLQDDVTKKRPTVDLTLRLLCPSAEARLAARRCFEPDAPLMRWELVTLHDDPGARRPVLLGRYLKLDERIAGFLLGSNTPDARLAPFTAPAPPPGASPLPPDIQTRVAQWAAAWDETWPDVAPVLLLHGRYGTGRRHMARELADRLRRPLLLLSALDLLTSELPLAQGLKLAEREARLTGALLGWTDTDTLLHPETAADPDHRAFVQSLARGRMPTLLLAEKAWEPARDLARRPFLRLELSEPSYAQRQQLWVDSLNGHAARLTPDDLSALTGRFRLTPGQMSDALARAQTLAWARDPRHGHVTLADIDAACRSQAQHRLSALARKLTPHYTWDDIVLPRPQLATLRLMCAMVRHRPLVYDDWGFDRKLAMGKGVVSLFAGPSGTGKTLAAEIMARDLGLDLYQIDLSSVVSKYIGETEKNLDRIFRAAEYANAVLFFDEADALFGKRSEVRDSHDRYANLEISYLLQRMEAYEGLAILATNLRQHLDEA